MHPNSELLIASVQRFEVRPTLTFVKGVGHSLSQRLILACRIKEHESYPGHLLKLTLHWVAEEGELAGIGDPPKPAIGTLHYVPHGEASPDEPMIWGDLHTQSDSFDVFRRTLFDAEHHDSDKTDCLVEIDTALSKWDKESLIFVLEFGLVTSSK